jgi:hypothetical protein
MEAKRDIEDIYSLFKAGMNFDTLALTYSQDGNSNQNGGDLGYIKKGDLEAEMENLIFSMKKGEVSEPFESSFGWHIIKVTDIKGSERRISHILIQITPGFETISNIRSSIDTLKQHIKKTDIETACKAFDVEAIDITLYKDAGDLIPEIGRVIGLSDYLFGERQKENEVIGPFIGYDGNYHIFQVVSYIDSYAREKQDVEDEIKEKVRREKALDIAHEEAKQCFEFIRNGKRMQEAASLFDKKLRTTDFFSMQDFIPAIPYSSEFYGLAFTLTEDEIGLASTLKGSFIIQLLERKDANREHFAAVTAEIFTNLIMTKREKMVQYWFQSLRDSANVKDNRHLLNIY